MPLEPCKVCGTLNAAETEICLSCGYPTEGRKRPAIFRWVAIALVVCFVLPFLSGIINWVLLELQPESPTPTQSEVSLNSFLTLRLDTLWKLLINLLSYISRTS